MFTGIVQSGTLKTIQMDAAAQTLHLMIAAPKYADTLGQSIAINGVCLTVTAFSESDFSVSISPETLRVTNAASWRAGDVVNLEKALTLNTRLDGHLVSGHVDGLARIIAIIPHGNNSEWLLEIPASLAKYIALKGSVCLDGVSLTVNSVTHQQFSVMLIPHTISMTNFAHKQVGDSLNLEIDIMARYVERLLSFARESTL